VSKLIARLEARLGARLFNRSTRQLHLTPEGVAFYEGATRILADLEEAERAVAAGEEPVGRVRLSTSSSYANHILTPLLPEFFARHPGVTLDIVQTDIVVDLVAERVDVAIRAGPLKSSSLVARKLGETPLMIVAAPSYIDRFGEPRTIADLERHNRLGFGYVRAIDGWPLQEDGIAVTVPVAGCAQVNDGEGLRHLALAGVGLARLSAFAIRGDIAAGRLIPIFRDLDPRPGEAFHAVYVGQGGRLPSRVRALLDFIAEYGRVD
jgi:DNA-binding transcriptional LysR family regulator